MNNEKKKTRREIKEQDQMITVALWSVIITAVLSIGLMLYTTTDRTTITDLSVLNEMVLKNNTLNLNLEYKNNFDLTYEPTYDFFYDKKCLTFIKETTAERIDFVEKGSVLKRNFLFETNGCEGEFDILLVIDTRYTLVSKNVKFNINSEALNECKKLGFVYTDYSNIAKSTECCSRIVGGYNCIILKDRNEVK